MLFLLVACYTARNEDSDSSNVHAEGMKWKKVGVLFMKNELDCVYDSIIIED